MDKRDKKLNHLQSGQALVEYVLIAVLVGGAFVVALLATGPVLGNIFESSVIATVGDEEQRDTPEFGVTSFWETVTWVAANPRQETPFPTNNANPLPTDVPLGYETAVPDTPVPTDEPEPSPTDEPSATPEDLPFDLLFNDPADTVDWYRLSSDVFIGQNAWTGLFWQDQTEADTYDPFTAPAGVQLVRNYDANWSNFLNPLTDLPRINEIQDFSARYSRPIFVYPNGAGTERLGFTVENPGGGYRLYYHTPTGLCSKANFNPPNSRNTLTGASPCIIIDQWQTVPDDSVTVFHDFDTGGSATEPAEYELVLEYYHETGSPNLQFDLFTPRVNPDDEGLAGDVVDCKWGQYEGDRTNTRTFSWAYSVGVDDMPNNSRCYLELRGYVTLENTDSDPADFTQVTDPPVMSFWHVWDLDPEVDVYLEIADYDPTYDEDGTTPGLQNFRNQFEDGTGDWTTVWSPTISGTENYEWTKEIVPLTGKSIGDTITYRFVIESNGSSAGRKRWYVDDIQIGNENLPDLTDTAPLPEDTFGICADITTCDSFWNLNDTAQAEDFRTTGRWALTSNSGAVDGMAWEDDPGYSYSLEDEGPRVYYIEFDKRVDVSGTSDNGLAFTDTLPDADGDTGPPLLSFWQTYNLNDNARLEIQYYDDTSGSWELLRTLVSTGGGSAFRPGRHYVEVPLNVRQTSAGVEETFADGWTAWNDGPLRLRFAMIVDGATSAPDGTGWTIDNILIERLGQVDFTPYPLYDSAGDGDGNTIAESRNTWTRTGLWDISSGDAYYSGDGDDDEYAYSDSPSGDYLSGSETELVLRAPMDLRSDTPSNPGSLTCDDTLPSVEACDVTPQDPAENPTLTFWWKRDLATDHNFRVVIRPNGGAGTEITVWEYIYDADDAEQNAWERAEIALEPFLPETGSNNDDDIIVAFQLDALVGSDTADGVRIDEIRIEDNVDNPVFLLGASTNGGNGRQYFDDIDTRTLVAGEIGGSVTFNDTSAARWWERFYIGGEWVAINTTDEFPAKTGVLALHESTPLSEDPFDIDESFRYDPNTFNVVEMVRHVDLSNVETLSRAGDPIRFKTGGDDGTPILSWWQRYDKGRRTRLRVQISRQIENPADPIGPLTYGDDELYGWEPWQNVYVTDPGNYNDVEQEYQWVRAQVNLEAARIYENDGDETSNFENYVGDTIRVRWILDANETVNDNNNDVRDGWFIDDIQFTTFVPNIYGDEDGEFPFADNASNMGNWIPEGTWGLDVEHYRGGATVPALAGDSGWTARFANCERRPDIGSTPHQKRTNNQGGCSGGQFTNILTTEAYRDSWIPWDDIVDGTVDVSAEYPDINNHPNVNSQWYVEDFVSGTGYSYIFDNGDEPPGAPNSYNWDDNFVAEFQRTVTVSEPFRYQIYVKADDGIRVGVTPFPTTAEVQSFLATQNEANVPVATNTYTIGGQTINYNNIIDVWKGQAPTVYTGSVTLVPNADNSPRDYILTAHHYEGGSSAEFTLGISGANASFSDSPMQIPSTNISDRVPVNYLSNTSMILDGLLDLRGKTSPVLNFYSIREISNVDTTFYIEVSEDGGFTWTDSGLGNDLTLADGTTVLDMTWNRSYTWDATDWDEHLYNLSDYSGRLISMRFRLDVNDDKNEVENEASNTDRRWNGVNIASILVFDADPDLPQPQIVSQSPQDVFVTQGADALLEVIATGAAPLRYQWYTGTSPAPADLSTLPADWTPVGFNRQSFEPDTSTIGTSKYWVIVSNAVSDNDASIDPVVSQPFTVRTLACAALEQGECGKYRIDFDNDTDLPTNDGSLPGWVGVEDEEAQFIPLSANNGADVIENNETSIYVPGSHDSPLVDAAINDTVDEESLYEHMIRTGTSVTESLTWALPVDNGAYIVRLYGADQNGNSTISGRDSGRFSMTLEGNFARVASGPGGYAGEELDGGAGDSYMELIDATANAVNPGSSDPLHRVAAIIDMDPVVVTDGVLNIEITPTESRQVNVSALEILPVTTTDLAIQSQPRDVNAVSGDQVELTVSASGEIDLVEWYTGVPGDTSNQVRSQPYGAGTTVVNDTLVLNNVTATDTYWARISNTGAGETLDSDAATVSVCAFDPNVLGSCNRWYLNLGEDTSTFTAVDGTVWHPLPSVFENSIDAADFKTDGVSTWNADNFSRDHTHLSDLSDSVFATRLDATDFGIDLTRNLTYTADVNVAGTYTVRIYFADPEENANRQFDIDFEGTRLLENFRLADAAGGTQRYRVEEFTVTVSDGTLNIFASDDGSTRSTISAIEVVPQSSN